MSGGAAGGSSQGSVVRVVGNVPACVPGGGDASLADLQIGIDNANHYVVPIRQIVQCARDAGERAAQTACQNSGSDLARHLGHGDALGMAMWGKHKQCTCNVKHVETVLDWAVEGHGGINVMVQEQRDELVAAVHKAACDLAATKLTLSRDAMADSIGVDIAGVDAEVRLRCLLQQVRATVFSMKGTAMLVAALCGFGSVKCLAPTAFWAEQAPKGAELFPRSSRACGSLRMQNFVSHGTADRRAVILGVASVKALCSRGALVDQGTLRVPLDSSLLRSAGPLPGTRCSQRPA